LSERRYGKSYPIRSLRGPVTLFVVVMILIVTLSVLWNLALVHDYQKLRALAQETAVHWTLIALGSLLFVAIIVLSSILSAQLFSQIRFNQRQSNFIASVSHELNSPLSAIKLFAQTLRQPELKLADRLNFVDKILFDVERLHRLIANILRAAETDHRGDELQVVLQQIELRSYLEDYLRDAESLYRPHRLKMSLDAVGDFAVRLDPLMFRQVLDNLLDNAVRYRGDKDPQVELKVSRQNEVVELRLRDFGRGIVAAELPKIFGRFYRIKENLPQQHKQGTGIGLYVVRSIIAGHGGRVGIESAGPGHGATVWISLPAAARGEKAAVVQSERHGRLESS
jgi:two-component system, OmpR family, phosphate regulon sensor histidine kinase PhoR